MALAQEIIAIRTAGQGLVEATREIAAWVASQEIRQGLLTVFIRHTSASLLIQENAAPEVRSDLENFMERLVPEDPALYAHDDEGPDDMPSHIRSALTQSHLAIPVDGGRLLLGTWQGVYVFEHRRRPHRRELVLHLAGE
jgi:secondary thiamine-phosphate synthase enzyme